MGDMKLPSVPQWRRELPWCAAIAALTAVVHAGILRLQWMYDDAFHIHFLLTHPMRFVVTPSLWRELPFRMYTPLQFVSYWFDLHVFGIVPRAWYAHQLISLGLAAAALFLLLRLWWEPATAAAGAALFALNPHIVGWAGLLMARHYIEGFVFACLSLAAYLLYLRGGRRSLLVAALVLYALSMLCKEIYVLIPLLLPKERRTAVSFAPVTVAYLLARYAMLGTFVGGYGWAVPPTMRLSFFAAAPFRIVASAFQPAMLWIPVIAATIVIAVKRPRLLIELLVALAVFVGPVVPVSTEIEARYVMLPALIGSLAALLSVFFLDRKWRPIALTVLGIWVVVAAWSGNRSDLQSLHRQSAESRFFLQLGPRDVLAHPAIPPASVAELDWLKTNALHGAAGTQWYFDDIYACSHDLAPKVVWSHDGARFVVIPPLASAKLPCSGQAGGVSIDMLHDGDAIYWNLRPENDSYEIILGEGIQAFAIPPSWGFHLGDTKNLTFRIRYTTPEGRAAYTPVLTFDFAKQRFHYP